MGTLHLHPHTTNTTKMTYVLPLYPVSAEETVSTTNTMDSVVGLTDWINKSQELQQMLEIEYEISNSVWKTSMNNFYVAANFGLTWEDVLGSQVYGVKWSTYKPTKLDWMKWHVAHAALLAIEVSNATGLRLTAKNIAYSVRKNSPKAKLYKVIIK